MDRYTNATDVAGDSPPSEAWAFAQAILGKPIPRIAPHQVKAKTHRAALEKRAPFLSRYARELRDLQVAERDGRRNREILEWAARISTAAQEKLRAIEQVEAEQRQAWHAAEQFTEADSLVTEWNEADHPRAPTGTPIGGQWVPKGGGGHGGGTDTGQARTASSNGPSAGGEDEPNPQMLELAHTWWQTKNALEQTRRDIEDLPKRIERNRAQLNSRYGHLYQKHLAKDKEELEAAKALLPQLEAQLRDLEREYHETGYDDIPYWTFTPGETVVGGKGIEQVGRAVARGGTPRGLQSTGIEFEIASALLAGPAILRLGKAVLGKAAAVARPKIASEAVALKPYGGAGGGHHVPAKSAFKGAAGYDAKAALAVPNEELAKWNVRHATVTGAQKRLYREFANTGAKLTWEEVARIETEALVRGGLNADVARATVKQAIDALKNSGVPGPVRIPWGN